eukprot:gb/GEZN01008604.1/.p1 GENE.gb/GEZN01008604.1/~~gb/GEZN01008604.1/.p1  ORF type:complete len:436 (+),score=49.25 gb/GEZN01008604.1/:30-1337(+)
MEFLTKKNVPVAILPQPSAITRPERTWMGIRVPLCQEEASVVAPALLAEDQNIKTMMSSAYWSALVPWLHPDASRETKADFLALAEQSAKRPLEKLAALNGDMTERGYWKIQPCDLGLPEGLCYALAMGVIRLVAHGHTPTAILAYEEAWLLGLIAGRFSRGNVTNLPIGDWFTFYVGEGHGYRPGPPHRDRPTAGPDSFHADGSPKYLSVWISLTSASPEQSCLYCIPKQYDPNYFIPGDSLEHVMPSPSSWQNIVALPLPAGGILGFSHRLVHWGSNPQPIPVCRDLSSQPVLPRIALTLAFADPSFEEPYFDPALLPFPPLGLRIALVSGQEIQYAHFSKMKKHEVALHNRIFTSQKTLFRPKYAEKVTTQAQWFLFTNKMFGQTKVEQKVSASSQTGSPLPNMAEPGSSIQRIMKGAASLTIEPSRKQHVL